MDDSEQRRGPPRVDFRAPIRVLTEDRAQVSWATSSNLSITGIWVSSMETFSVGTELGLDIPVPGGEASLAFRCRVVWVERERRCGMGLEFVDLNVEERGTLRQMVKTKDLSRAWSRPVKIWFDGQPMPVTAQAIPNRDGLVVGIELPHLRSLSKVMYRFEEQDGDEGETGVLEGIYLDTGDVPQLMVSIRPDEGYQTTITTWPPPPTGETPQEPAAPPDQPPPAEESNGLEMRSGEISPVDLPQPSEEAFDEDEISVEIDEDFAEEESSLDELTGLDCLSDEQLAALSPDRGAREQSFQKMRPLESSGLRSLWLWIAAVAMTALAVASMAYTGLFSRVQSAGSAISSDPVEEAILEQNPRAPGKEPAVTAPDFAAAAPSAPAPAPAGAGPAPARVDDDKDDNAGDAPRPEAEPTSTSTETPTPTSMSMSMFTHQPTYNGVAGGLEMRFPIKGSIKDANHYSIDKPNGVAINLPAARSTGEYGTYRITDQKLVRLFWVKKRMGGIQLRVFFRGEKMRSYEVDLKPGLVKLTVKE